MATTGKAPTIKMQVRLRDRSDPRYATREFEVSNWQVKEGILLLTMPIVESSGARTSEEIGFPLGALLSFEAVLTVVK